jgi:hypothetical protein
MYTMTEFGLSVTGAAIWKEVGFSVCFTTTVFTAFVSRLFQGVPTEYFYPTARPAALLEALLEDQQKKRTIFSTTRKT